MNQTGSVDNPSRDIASIKTEFVPYDESFLELSGKWLRDEEIKALTLSPDIDDAAQKAWFESLRSREDYFIRGIIADGKKIGALGLKHIDYDARQAEYWGYIGEKQYIGRGIGKVMLQYIEDIAVELQLSSVYLNVADFNERAISLYKRNGFSSVNTSNRVIRMEKNLV